MVDIAEIRPRAFTTRDGKLTKAHWFVSASSRVSFFYHLHTFVVCFFVFIFLTIVWLLTSGRLGARRECTSPLMRRGCRPCMALEERPIPACECRGPDDGRIDFEYERIGLNSLSVIVRAEHDLGVVSTVPEAGQCPNGHRNEVAVELWALKDERVRALGGY
jgi:hypothetical protein